MSGKIEYNLRFIDGDKSNISYANIQWVVRGLVQDHPDWVTDYEFGPIAVLQNGVFTLCHRDNDGPRFALPEETKKFRRSHKGRIIRGKSE